MNAVQPAIVAGPLVDGDLCEIGRYSPSGRQCGQPGVVEALDANDRVRVLCAEHRDMYFPSHARAA